MRHNLPYNILPDFIRITFVRISQFFYRARPSALRIWIYTYATSQCLWRVFADNCVDFYITLDRFNDVINWQIRPIHRRKLVGSVWFMGKKWEANGRVQLQDTVLISSWKYKWKPWKFSQDGQYSNPSSNRCI